jgi:hypothetical protein
MKNSYKITLLITLFITLIASAQEKLKGNKEVTTENRPLSEFTKIEVIDNIDVLLAYGENQSVSVETDSNLQHAILTTVNNGMLSIKINNKISKKKELVVHIRVNKGFKEINSYNSSNIKSNNSLIIDSLTINAFDNSDYNLQINSKIININSKKNSDLKLQILSDKIFVIGEESSTIKGTFDSKEAIFKLLDKSSVNIDGSTTIFEIETLGNTSFKGKDFKAKNAVLNVTNSSDTYVNAIETIDIRAKNSSNVYLYSNPKIKMTEFFDKASLNKKEL